jgi:hypothetical protein
MSLYLCAAFQIVIPLTDFQKIRYESYVTDRHANMQGGSDASTQTVDVRKIRNVVNCTK